MTAACLSSATLWSSATPFYWPLSPFPILDPIFPTVIILGRTLNDHSRFHSLEMGIVRQFVPMTLSWEDVPRGTCQSHSLRDISQCDCLLLYPSNAPASVCMALCTWFLITPVSCPAVPNKSCLAEGFNEHHAEGSSPNAVLVPSPSRSPNALCLRDLVSWALGPPWPDIAAFALDMEEGNECGSLGWGVSCATELPGDLTLQRRKPGMY